jgi:hypothetical protein
MCWLSCSKAAAAAATAATAAAAARRARGLVGVGRSPALVDPDEVAMGSSYSLSHGSSRAVDSTASSSSGHSWFGWLKGDSSSSSSRDRGDREAGLAEGKGPTADKPRNEHEEVQVGTWH